MQDKNRLALEQQLSQNFTKDVVDKVLDIKPYVDPKVTEMHNKLNDPNAILTEGERSQMTRELQLGLKKALENAGGYDALVDRNLGRMLRGDFGSIMQSAAKMIQQGQMQSGRSLGTAGFTGGAPTAQPQGSGAIQFNSESVYR